MKILIILFLILLPVVSFCQTSFKFGVGDGYLPKLTQTNYGFEQKQSFYVAGVTEMEVYFQNSGVGIAVDAELTSVKTSSLGFALKVSDAKWQGARRYSLGFYAGTLNKDGVGILTLGVQGDLRLSWLLPKTASSVFKNFDLLVRFYLPAKMFSKSKITNDVCASFGVKYSLFSL